MNAIAHNELHPGAANFILVENFGLKRKSLD